MPVCQERSCCTQGTGHELEKAMKRRTIAYVMDADTPDDQIHDAAEAATEDETHLNCLVLAPAPAMPTGCRPTGA